MSRPCHTLKVADGGRVGDAIQGRLAREQLESIIRSRAAVSSGEGISSLLVVQAWGEKEGIKPGRTTGDGGAPGDCAQVCEGDEATCRREEAAWHGILVPVDYGARDELL